MFKAIFRLDWASAVPRWLEANKIPRGREASDTKWRHLRHFIAVAAELHFARAAGRLHFEHSPLSRAINGLE
jgi:hypothetical protein